MGRDITSVRAAQPPLPCSVVWVQCRATWLQQLRSSDGTLSCWKLNCQENLNRYYLISTENLEHFHISVLKNSKLWSQIILNYKLKMFKISKRPFVSSTVQSEAPTCPKCISKRRVWRCNVKCVCMYSIKNINIESRAGHSIEITDNM